MNAGLILLLGVAGYLLLVLLPAVVVAVHAKRRNAAEKATDRKGGR